MSTTQQEVLSVEVTSEDVLRGKFSNTLTMIESYRNEAYNAEEDYSASTVEDRFDDVKKSMEAELLALAKVMSFRTNNSK